MAPAAELQVFSDAQQGADAVRSAAESSRQAGEQASEALGSAIRTASDQVAEGAWSLADAATSTVASTKARAGATADKLGAAVSTAAEAEVEDQLIGDASDRLKGQARNFAQEQYEKGKEMAQNAVHEAAEKAGDRVRAGLGDGDAGSPAESQETAGAPAMSGEPARS